MEHTIKLKESFAVGSFTAATEKCSDLNGIESCTLNSQPIIPIQIEVYFQIEDWFGFRDDLLLNEVV